MLTGIEFLHILQDIRMDFPILEDFFLAISSRVFYMVIPIMMVVGIYWLFDREKGEIISLGCVSATIASSIVKLIVAQPRPWILDPTLERVPGAHADGYSLPSGHVTLSASTYLPMAWYYRKKVILAIILVVVVVLIMMARLVLCVHTPLDVLTGIITAVVMVLLAVKAVEIGKRSDRAYYMVSAAYIVLFTIATIYACFHIEVDLKEILQSSGFFYGLMIGRLIEHRYVGYTIKERTNYQKLKAFIIGILIAAVLLGVPMLAIPDIGTFIGGVLLMVWCYALYPMVMMKKDI